ncbi:MAG: saccharopine dehydrogenase NADP-binding domain-containing protein [Phycisphaerales bacterium]|nr:MAG: saccharopine dehydrogenase NADP-binding domain-containing protein [Phycisphaerales bacterium]
MTKKAVVLGCGLVGAAVAKDLVTDHGVEVTAVDCNPENLRRLNGNAKITTRHADLSKPSIIKEVVLNADIVIGALPGRLGPSTLRAVVESGRNYCDTSFMEQDASDFNDLARNSKVTAVVDCGVAPGLSNMIAGYLNERLERLDKLHIYVGGLPKKRTWPFHYKAPFSPADVIEVYTRPTRLVENGKVVVRPALSEAELIDFPWIGTLEAFNTDGLRTLISNIDAPDMREKTLRYPGHVELMRVFREVGLFDLNEIEIRGVRVRPRDLTSMLLFPRWAFDEGEEDFTLMRVIAEGTESSRRMRHTYDLYDEYDREKGQSSMARTTGFPCAIVARLIVSRRFTKPGIHPPEALARHPDLFEHVLAELAKRGVVISSTQEPIDSE